ncbi:hypothetical protein UlMin_036467 [Ulmus minor]
MGKLSQRRWLCLINVCSVLFVLSLANQAVGSSGKNSLSWSRRAAEEAELVAAIDCSGHGRAYLDGLLGNGSKYPVCECNLCYEGSDCSQLQPDCSADATRPAPLSLSLYIYISNIYPYFLEPFWMKQAAQSAILESGWHRMGYSFSDGTYISKRLENHIRELHKIVGNAIVDGRYIIFGSGSTQLLNAAVHALSSDNISDPATVLASIPYYGFYQRQTAFFQSTDTTPDLSFDDTYFYHHIVIFFFSFSFSSLLIFCSFSHFFYFLFLIIFFFCFIFYFLFSTLKTILTVDLGRKSSKRGS